MCVRSKLVENSTVDMWHRSSVVVFLVGIAVGIFLPVLYFRNAAPSTKRMKLTTTTTTSSIHMKRNSNTRPRLVTPVEFSDSRLHADDTSTADRLYRDVRVLCLVFVAKDNALESAIPVNSTWGRRCNGLLFVSTKNEDGIPTVVVDDSQNTGRHSRRTREALDKVFANRLVEDDYEWLVKAYVGTYIILENLRYFLSTKDHRKPVYFSDRRTDGKQDDTGCGTTYVFSREAVRLFGQRNRQLCKFESGRVDTDFDNCNNLLGITLGESMDRLERDLYPQERHKGTLPRWLRPNVQDIQSGKQEGVEKNASDYAVAFHYLQSADIYTVEYFVYHLNPYGIAKDQGQNL